MVFGVGGDVMGGAGPLVAGGDDGAHQLRCVVAGAAAGDVQPVGLGVVMLGFPAVPLIGVASAMERIWLVS